VIILGELGDDQIDRGSRQMVALLVDAREARSSLAAIYAPQG
jgi:hypothetical protein